MWGYARSCGNVRCRAALLGVAWVRGTLRWVEWGRSGIYEDVRGRTGHLGMFAALRGIWRWLGARGFACEGAGIVCAAVCGDAWGFAETCGYSRECAWVLAKVRVRAVGCGNVRGRAGSRGNARVYTGVRGNLRGRSGLFGVAWECTGLRGNLRGRAGTFGNLRGARQFAGMRGGVGKCAVMCGYLLGCAGICENVRGCVRIWVERRDVRECAGRAVMRGGVLGIVGARGVCQNMRDILECQLPRANGRLFTGMRGNVRARAFFLGKVEQRAQAR